MNSDIRTVEPHGVRSHQMGSRAEHDGGARDGHPPVASDETPRECYHYSVEWDTNESEWRETSGTE